MGFPDSVPNKYWIGGYMVCGIICIVIGILYAIFIWRDFKSLTPKLPGYKSSQILFIIGSLSRGIGWTVQAMLIILMKNTDPSKFDPITVGLPGYLLTISYVFLFYLWASICVNLIANDSTTGVRERIKNVVNYVLIFILTLGSVLIGITILQIFIDDDKLKIIHEVEAFIALLRDFITATIILVHTVIIIQMSEKPLFSLRYNESIYFWMLLCLIASLYARFSSLIYYLYKLIEDNNKDGSDYIKSSGEYINTFITAFIAELLPCFMILINRKRSGLLSVYDIID